MGLTLYPAIDLQAGRVVRLRQGAMDSATVFGDEPDAIAARFVRDGAAWLHVVDLDGAIAGQPVNTGVVRRILAAAGAVPVQLGGGIRDAAAIAGWLDAGVRRVILGSVAAKHPDIVRIACHDHPGRIVIGIDARNGMVATEGWAATSHMTALELARRFEDAGAAAIVFTDISRDGMLGGLNIPATHALAETVETPVIASGGVSGAEDLRELAADAGRIEGVIVGRALYEGRLTIEMAQAALAAC